MHPYAGDAFHARRIGGNCPFAEIHCTLLATCLLIFVAGMVVVVANGRKLFFGITPLARAVLLLPLLSAMLTGLTLFLAVLAWRHGCWSPWRRLHDSLLGLSGLAFFGLLHDWKLLGLGF